MAEHNAGAGRPARCDRALTQQVRRAKEPPERPNDILFTPAGVDEISLGFQPVAIECIFRVQPRTEVHGYPRPSLRDEEWLNTTLERMGSLGGILNPW